MKSLDKTFNKLNIPFFVHRTDRLYPHLVTVKRAFVLLSFPRCDKCSYHGCIRGICSCCSMITRLRNGLPAVCVFLFW